MVACNTSAAWPVPAREIGRGEKLFSLKGTGGCEDGYRPVIGVNKRQQGWSRFGLPSFLTLEGWRFTHATRHFSNCTALQREREGGRECPIPTERASEKCTTKLEQLRNYLLQGELARSALRRPPRHCRQSPTAQASRFMQIRDFQEHSLRLLRFKNSLESSQPTSFMFLKWEAEVGVCPPSRVSAVL